MCTTLLFTGGLLSLLLALIGVQATAPLRTAVAQAAPYQQDSPLSAAQLSPLTSPTTTVPLSQPAVVTQEMSSAAVTSTVKATADPADPEKSAITATTALTTATTAPVSPLAPPTVATTTVTQPFTTTAVVTTTGSPSQTATVSVTAAPTATAVMPTSPLPTPTSDALQPAPSADTLLSRVRSMIASGQLSLVLVGVLFATFFGVIGLVIVQR
ncbi:MAG TPA: hypothetical protein P5121_18860 [Caldilineaceae bacterium]|nr:hypothetical protein [Caldilineaceae bacterium]